MFCMSDVAPHKHRDKVFKMSTTGNELQRIMKVRYCKECAKQGIEVRLSSYNPGDRCLRHPIPESKRFRYANEIAPGHQKKNKGSL
jgi:hypothetical protein